MKRSFAVAWAQGCFAALPFLEIYRSFFHSKLQILGLAAEEAILLLMSLSVLAAGAAYALKRKQKKRLLVVFGALAVLLIYTLIHAAWAAGFDADLVPHAVPSFPVECYYVLRLYLAPFALLGGMILLEFSAREIMPAVKLCAGIAAGVTLFCFLTGTGFGTYMDGNTPVKGGFFAWLLGGCADYPSKYASKGFFSDGNALGAVFFILSPLIFRDALAKSRKWYDLVLSFAVGFAGIAVGTRVGSVGTLLMLALSLVLALIGSWRQKAPRPALRRAVPVVILFAVLASLLPFTPGFALQTGRAAAASTERAVTESVPADDKELPAYVEEHGWDHYVDDWFRKVYPPEDDPDFWRDVLERDGRLNQNNRSFKTELVGRIVERDGRAGDLWLGIGRTSNVPYSEQDLAFQVQVYGVLGAFLLLLPFAGAGILSGINGVRRFFAREDATLSLALFASFVAAFGAAFLAGHVFDTAFPTYALLLPAGMVFTCAKAPR